MIGNNELEEKNRQLKIYEAKAWKLLNAKDEELLERERIVEEKGSYSARPQTLLPPA